MVLIHTATDEHRHHTFIMHFGKMEDDVSDQNSAFMLEDAGTGRPCHHEREGVQQTSLTFTSIMQRHGRVGRPGFLENFRHSNMIVNADWPR